MSASQVERSVDEDAAATIAAVWGLRAPVRLTPATSGTQNQTFVVETDSGKYVLRRYSNVDDPRRVLYEHAILAAIDRLPLSFRVAAPLPSLDGRTVAPLAGSLAALFPWLDGTCVDRTSEVHARACGAALAELHGALRRVDAGPPPPGTFSYGDLERIHPHVPDPWSLPEALPLDARDRERFRAIIERLRTSVPALYAALPHQLCHNDFSPGNLLMCGDAVGAVLDFEFAAPDLRAIDICTAWYWMALRDTGGAYSPDLPIIRALLDGYAATAASDSPLTLDERAAMPVLALLRGCVSVIHREGRRRAGLDTERPVLERVRLLFDLEAWCARGDSGQRFLSATVTN